MTALPSGPPHDDRATERWTRVVDAVGARVVGEGRAEMPCPAHGGEKANGLVISVGEASDFPAVFCRTEHCDYADVRAALLDLGAPADALQPAKGGGAGQRPSAGSPARRVAAPQAAPVLPTEQQVEAWHEALMGEPMMRRVIKTKWRVDDETLQIAEVGWDEQQGCFTFPVRDAAGDVVQMIYRDFRDDRTAGVPKSRTHRGVTGSHLYVPFGVERGRRVVLCAGERDAFAAHGIGLNAVSVTNGERAAPAPDRLALLRDAEVALAYDNDDAGRSGAHVVAAAVAEVASKVWVADLSAVPGLPLKGDVADVLAMEGGEVLLRSALLAATPWEGCGEDVADADVERAVANLWTKERARRQFAAEVVAERNAKSRGNRQMDGAEFVLDVPPSSAVLWGLGEEALWTAGEGLLLVGSDGVGKTTVAQQLALRRLGVKDDLLQYPVEPADGQVLYLAMDRPDQARRSFARMLPADKRDEYRDVLKERLVVWRGPVPVDVLAAPDALANWIHTTFGSDVADVVADSYKDLAAGLSDDATGAGINSAMQEVLARGLNWLGIHHQRKATGDNKSPTALSDVYGSRWITAGMGSVLMFVGDAGADTVELRHLKQPAQAVGPLLVQHFHASGQTSVMDKTSEPLDVLKAAPDGMTLHDLATAVYGNTDAATKKRVERAMYGAEQRGEVCKVAARRGGEGGSRPARYFLPEHAPSSDTKDA